MREYDGLASGPIINKVMQTWLTAWRQAFHHYATIHGLRDLLDNRPFIYQYADFLLPPTWRQSESRVKWSPDSCAIFMLATSALCSWHVHVIFLSIFLGDVYVQLTLLLGIIFMRCVLMIIHDLKSHSLVASHSQVHMTYEDDFSHLNLLAECFQCRHIPVIQQEPMPVHHQNLASLQPCAFQDLMMHLFGKCVISAWAWVLAIKWNDLTEFRKCATLS